MHAIRATLIALTTGAVAAGGVYNPGPGSYNSDRDPSTIVRIHTGVGSVRFQQRLGRIRVSTFGSIRGERRIPKAARGMHWIVRSFGAISVVARTSNPRPVVAFILRSPAYRTPLGFGIGDNMRQTRIAFGVGRQLVSHGTVLPVFQFRRAGTRILVRFDAPSKPRARVIAWAIVRDPQLSLVSEVLRPG